MHATPSRWKFLLVFALAGVGLHAAVGIAVCMAGVAFWPFNSLSAMAAFTLLGGVGGMMFGHALHAQRVLRNAAAEDPVEPLATPSSADDADPASLPDMPVFADRVALARRSAKRVGDLTADVFDLTTETSDGDGGVAHITRTYVLLPAQGLPTFVLQPWGMASQLLASVGIGGVRFDSAAAETAADVEVVRQFEATYRLNTSAEPMTSGRVASDDAVRRVFTVPTLRAVLGRADWRVQCHQDHLVFWTHPEPLGPQRRAKLVADAVALHAVLVRAHATDSPERVMPAPPGALSPQRQAARLQAALLGALLGGFLGFFAAAILSARAFLAAPAGQRVLDDNFGGPRFLLCVLAGVLAGGGVGLLLPLRQPLLVKPTDRRRETIVGCAVGIGFFGGFFAGGVAGAALGEMLALKFDDGPLRATLLFGGMGLGAIACPVILGVATNGLYRWVIGERGGKHQAADGG